MLLNDPQHITCLTQGRLPFKMSIPCCDAAHAVTSPSKYCPGPQPTITYVRSNVNWPVVHFKAAQDIGPFQQ